MRKAMEAFGDMVCLDGTYKLLNLELTLMLFLVEDSCTHSEIVEVALLQYEDHESFEWLNKTFKSVHGKNCEKIMCLMADKDLLERDVLKEVFPGIPIYICRFHALKSFSKSFAKYVMSKSVNEECLRIVQNMVYCKTQQAYDDLYGQLSDIAPEKACKYFNSNWHNIKHEWKAFSMNVGNLGNFTNNRLESINKHIKTVVKKRSSLIDFLEKFFILVQSHNHENDAKTAKALLKRPNINSLISDNEKEYFTFLMPEPFEKIKYEMKKINSDRLMHIVTIQKMSVYCGKIFVTSKLLLILVNALSTHLGCYRIDTFFLRDNYLVNSYFLQICVIRDG